MVSKVGKNLIRANGLTDGDGTTDSSVYLDGHTAVVDVPGRDAGSAAFLVRGLDRANAPAVLFRVDKDGGISGGYGVFAFGAIGDGVHDDGPAFSAALAAAGGRPVYVPAGTYRIATQILYQTAGEVPGARLIGAGMYKTILDSAVSGACIKIDGSGGLPSTSFQYGIQVADLSIVTTTSPVGGRGIDVVGGWYVEIERVRIEGLSADAIRLFSEAADADSPHFVRVTQCGLLGNGGWGIHVNPDVAIGTIGCLDVVGSQIVQNASGGVKWSGIACRLAQCSFSYNGGPGVYALVNGVQNQLLEVADSEFDSNLTAHVQIDHVFGALIQNCAFSHGVFGGTFRPTRAVIVGDGTHAPIGVEIRRCRVRSTPTNPSLATTVFEVKALAESTQIQDTAWPSFSGANATRFSDAGTNTLIRDEGRMVGMLGAPTIADIADGTTFTPDLFGGSYYRLRTLGATAIIATPLNPSPGRELVFSVFNGAGAPTAVTWGAGYLMAGYTDPAAAKRRTARFVYDGSSFLWIQVGAWSPDL